MHTYCMKRDNACNIVAGSSLMLAVRRKYGDGWRDIPWVRLMLAGYARALECERDTDCILDKMEDAAGRISGDTAAA